MDELEPDRLYRALCARDARFDGLFFVAVETTGIYCRPICPARTPGRARCRFYARAAEAERAGYRACFRCRPERAPGGAPVDAAPALVRRALAAIADGALDRVSVDGLGAELGVGARHLRRTLEAAIGVTPIELAQTRRLGLAKQLLQDTSLPITELAYAAGFASLRRFNAAFAERFGTAPTQIRRRGAPDGRAADRPRLRLEARGPFPADATLRFLAARALPGLEEVTARGYRRVVAVGDAGAVLEAAPDPERPGLIVTIDPLLLPQLGALLTRLRALFDLDARPDLIDGHLARDPRLRRRVAACPGLRVPGAFDRWEALVRIILGQQVSVRAATTLSGRLIERLGAPIAVGGGAGRAFPSPERIASRTIDAIAAVGLPGARAEALRAVARRVASGRIDLLPSADPARVAEALLAVPGIGPWTVQAFAMRALRDPDAFLGGDLAVRRALGVGTTAAAEAAAIRWRPWRAYALMHLWHTQGG